jgi:hypothetical protein
MNQALVKRVLELSGPVQDAARFEHYLHTLPTAALEQKVRDLVDSQERNGSAGHSLPRERKTADATTSSWA